MSELTPAEREAAIALAARAIEAAERNRADENPNRGELAALEANAQKQARNRALLGLIHERPIDQGDEDDD